MGKLFSFLEMGKLFIYKNKALLQLQLQLPYNYNYNYNYNYPTITTTIIPWLGFYFLLALLFLHKQHIRIFFFLEKNLDQEQTFHLQI